MLIITVTYYSNFDWPVRLIEVEMYSAISCNSLDDKNSLSKLLSNSNSQFPNPKTYFFVSDGSNYCYRPPKF